MIQSQAALTTTCHNGIGGPPPNAFTTATPKSLLLFSTHYKFPSGAMAMAMPSTGNYRMRSRRRRKRDTSTFLSSSSPSAGSSPQPDEDAQRKGPDLPTLLRRFWKVAAPYWYSDDKVEAQLQLAAVFALSLGTTGISVGFSFLGRDFYNALANKDQEQFTKQLLYYLGAFAGGIPIFVLRDYARETLSLRWRSWMTNYYIDRYLKNRTFYKIQSQSIIDNPDQRIVDDLSSFTGTALSFSLTLFNAAVDLVSFSNILYGIYPPLFAVLLVYSIGGTAISVFLGRGLVTLNFLQEKKEADFRFGLVRLRENAESIAFYAGEDNEKQLLLQRFRSAFENLTQLLISSRNLEFFTNGYRYLIQILPAAVVAPMYFSGKIEFGVINQSVSAFNHILGDFSLIVYQFQAISAFSAVIDRLGEFDDVLDSSSSIHFSDPLEEIRLIYCNVKFSTSLQSNGSIILDNRQKLLDIENLTLQTPSSKATLVRDLSLKIYEKDHLLVTGPSGSGKTSLLRAIAGLWSTGRGKIRLYVQDTNPQSALSPELAPLEATVVDDTYGNLERSGCRNSSGVFFLPQRPYMVLGTLRQQLLYPIWTEDSISTSENTKQTGLQPFLMPGLNSKDVCLKPQKPTTDDLLQVLKDVRLSYILSRLNGLDSTCEWSSVLSLGEQQRLAFARLLLSKPYLVLLDESTSALDEANEVHLYQKIEAAGITYISIGHRSTLYKHHNRRLHISTIDPLSSQRNWCIDSINEDTLYNISRQ
ncbi:ABC transporter D family member 2, chloroplastic [Camellia sinensis]|uniref:ABC transporter D family member 2, chloroplastic n=1 Tax=Camellia sinensis TaxID=4442 RepID=UPI0010369D45|nr:ABC transporter D family member 2, chloroplastic [Camellia sinensis]